MVWKNQYGMEIISARCCDWHCQSSGGLKVSQVLFVFLRLFLSVFSIILIAIPSVVVVASVRVLVVLAVATKPTEYVCLYFERLY